METHKFTIIVSTSDDWETSVVQVMDNDPPLIAEMAACEYLIHVFASKSNMPYDEAVRLLKKGATTYKDVSVN